MSLEAKFISGSRSFKTGQKSVVEPPKLQLAPRELSILSTKKVGSSGQIIRRLICKRTYSARKTTTLKQTMIEFTGTECVLAQILQL